MEPSNSENEEKVLLLREVSGVYGRDLSDDAVRGILRALEVYPASILRKAVDIHYRRENFFVPANLVRIIDECFSDEFQKHQSEQVKSSAKPPLDARLLVGKERVDHLIRRDMENLGFTSKEEYASWIRTEEEIDGRKYIPQGLTAEEMEKYA